MKKEHFDKLETRSPKKREAQLMAELPRLIAHAKRRAPGFGRAAAALATAIAEIERVERGVPSSARWTAHTRFLPERMRR